jgi:hypothetical protein
MHRHEWELLDRQMSHLQPTPRGLDALVFAALFLAGMMAGAFIFAGAGQPVQTASKNGKTALARFYGTGNQTR